MSINWNTIITVRVVNDERKSTYFDFPNVIIQDPAPIKGKDKGITPKARVLSVSQRGFKAFYDSLSTFSLDYRKLDDMQLSNAVKNTLGLDKLDALRLLNLCDTEGRKSAEPLSKTEAIVSLFSYMDPIVNPPSVSKSEIDHDVLGAIKEFIKSNGKAGQDALRLSKTTGRDEVHAYLMDKIESLMDRWNATDNDIKAILIKLESK